MITFLQMHAQPAAYSDTWQEVYNALTDMEDIDEEGWLEAYEILTTMADTPQNINSATIDDLMAIPLLSEKQVFAIMSYRSMYGDLRTIDELHLITALDAPRISILKAIFYAKATTGAERIMTLTLTDSLSRAMSESQRMIIADSLYKIRSEEWRKDYVASPYHHNLLATMNIPTYNRKGYGDGTYAGKNVSHSIRYKYHSPEWMAALTAAQDAGEPFFTGTNKKGWDFYTGYVMKKSKGVVRKIIAGHYQTSLGMGLVMNTDFRLSRSAMVSTMPKTNANIRGHASKSEFNYMQGIAASIQIPISKDKTSQLAITPFISYRPLDATLSDSYEGSITTILKTGYHRTVSEINRRNSTYLLTAGGSAEYISAPFRVGLNVVYNHLRDSLSPDVSQMYRWYMPAGVSFLNTSLSYSYTGTRIQLAGETAISKAGRHYAAEKSGIAPATINAIRYKATDYWQLFAIYRYYSYKYQSLTGLSFGDVSTCQNENGLYIGATTTAVRHMTLSAYADLVYHPWVRYGYKGASRSCDTYLMATYKRKTISASLRYRYKEQALTETSSWWPAFASDINGTAQHTLRIMIKDNKPHWRWMTQAHSNYMPTAGDWGYALLQAVGYSVKKNNSRSYKVQSESKHPFSCWASVAYFRTSDYASRVYLTDNSLKYASGFNMVYGEGMRANIIAECDVTKNILLSLQCTTTKYFDRTKISSGPQTIDSSQQTDLRIQMLLRL